MLKFEELPARQRADLLEEFRPKSMLVAVIAERNFIDSHLELLRSLIVDHQREIDRMERQAVILDRYLETYDSEPQPAFAATAQTAPDTSPAFSEASAPSAVESVETPGALDLKATDAPSSESAAREDAGDDAPGTNSPALHIADQQDGAGNEAEAPVDAKRPKERTEEPESIRRRQEVARLHARSPDLTPEEAAAKLQMPLMILRTFTLELGIAWSPAPTTVGPEPELPKRTLRDRVQLLFDQHPNWTARMIAKEIGAPQSSVAVYLSRIRNGSPGMARAAHAAALRNGASA